MMHILRSTAPILFFLLAIGYSIFGNLDRGALFLILSYVMSIDNTVNPE
jgi:hypothetical protein